MASGRVPKTNMIVFIFLINIVCKENHVGTSPILRIVLLIVKYIKVAVK